MASKNPTQWLPDQSKSFKTRAEALVWARKTESDFDNGIITQPVNSKILLKELLEGYKNEVTCHKKGESPRLH